MKLLLLSLTVPFLGSMILPVAGFPPPENLHHGKRCPYADLKARSQGNEDRDQEKRFFDLMKKPIEVTGDHEFIPPDFAAGDQRGPCPGLNALANHGYIPRNGVTSMAEVIFAINKVYGMGLDLATILAVMGTVWVGNPLSILPGFSIGGPTNQSENILKDLLGVVGTPQGLQGSHNLIESDSSNTRGDLYSTGNAHTMHMDKFMAFYNMSREHPTGDYNMDLLARRAADRFEESKSENPYFYYGPFTGMIARNAGYIFAGRLLANHSKEEPQGVMTKETLKSFFGVYGDEDHMEYREGWERIPENWYRTPVDYGLIGLNLDLIDWVVKYPELASIGGNTGEINTFTGLDLGNLTGGLMNLPTLLENNNLICFVLQLLKTLTPNSLSGVLATLEVPLKLITDALMAPILDLSCPAFDDLTNGGEPIWESFQEMFAGAAKSGTSL